VHVPHSDVLVRQCQECGAYEWESDGSKPMAWVKTEPGSRWPIRYAYPPMSPAVAAMPRLWLRALVAA